MKQTRANQLTLKNLEHRPALRERVSEAIDVVAEPLLVVERDA
jgi:hypothetical protein